MFKIEHDTHRPSDEIMPGRTALWFCNNPQKFITVQDITTQFTEWNGVYTLGNITVLIHDARRILHERLHNTGRILTVLQESGYVYYPAIVPNEYITPDGYRPIPAWRGDAARVADLQKLFAIIRPAVVKPDLLTARPLLTKLEYRYFVVLSYAYAIGQRVDVDKILRYTEIDRDAINVYRKRLKEILAQQTSEKWTIEHQRGEMYNTVEDGVDYLVQVSTARSGSAGFSSPRSLSAT